MNKSLLKTCILIITAFLSFAGMTNLNAADKLQLVQSTGGIKNFGAKDGFVEKSIIASNLESGEVTIQLMVSNARKTEIIFVIDNSTQIGAITNLKSNLVTSLKTLVTSLHTNANLKTSIMQMHPYGTTTTTATNGGLISSLNDNKDITESGLDTYLANAGADGQDFIEVLEAANDSFSDDADNKIIVLITTGMDSTHVNEYKSAIIQAEETADVVSFIIENDDPYIEDIFGDGDDHTATAHFATLIIDLNSTINVALNSYLNGLLPFNKYDILLEDFFTNNIVNNFDIEYIGNPSQGVVSAFNASEKKFSWTIDDLLENNYATFTYKLKLKTNYDTSLEDVILNTNDKVVVTYIDKDTENQSLTYDINPTIKIISTLSNPKTGLYDYFIPSSIIFCLSVLTISIIKRKEVFINM